MDRLLEQYLNGKGAIQKRQIVAQRAQRDKKQVNEDVQKGNKF